MKLSELTTILLLAAAGPLQAQVVIRSVIKEWPEYKQARVSIMKPLDEPDGAKPDKPRELPPVPARKVVETDLNAALKRLGHFVTGDYKWEPSSGGWFLACDDADSGRVLAAISAEDMALTYLSVTRATPLHPNLSKDSPLSFTRYAADCYHKVFGEEPVGDAALKGHLAQANGMTYDGEVVWNCIEGELHLGNNTFSLQYKDPGEHDMTLYRQVSSAELRDCRECLAKFPVEVDERMAVAIVFKTWEGLGKIPAERAADEMSHASSIARSESQTSQVRYFSDRMAWKNTKLAEDSLPPYVRKVSLSWGLFTVEAELNWQTGEILWMRQGTMGW